MDIEALSCLVEDSAKSMGLDPMHCLELAGRIAASGEDVLNLSSTDALYWENCIEPLIKVLRCGGETSYDKDGFLICLPYESDGKYKCAECPHKEQ